MRKSLFIIISTAMLMTGCMMKKYFIDDYDQSWFDCYNKSDTLVFESGCNQIRFVVDTVYIDNPQNHNPFDWEGTSFARYFEVTDEINGYGTIEMSQLNRPNVKRSSFDRVDIKLSISKSSYVTSDDLFARVGDLWVTADRKLFLNKAKQDYLSDKKERLFRAADFIKKRQPEDSVTDFEWRRDRGLLSFTVRDTTVYRLVEKIPQDRL